MCKMACNTHTIARGYLLIYYYRYWDVNVTVGGDQNQPCEKWFTVRVVRDTDTGLTFWSAGKGVQSIRCMPDRLGWSNDTPFPP